MEEAKRRNADNETKDTELCLPTIDSVSSGPKNDTKRRRVQLPRRVTHAFGDQPSHQYLSMHAPVGIFPVAHDQDTMNSRDFSRTWLMDLYHQCHHSHASTTPNATTIWGNDMLQPMPLYVFQNIHRMTGSAGVQIGTDHQEVPQEFSAIMNASRRAAISSMMTLPGSALMPEGIRCIGEQTTSNIRWCSAPEYQSFKETHTELTTPMTEGIRCIGEQPTSNNGWYAAPECQSYHHSQASTTPNATTIWGDDRLNRTNINMLQPMPLDVFQNIQLMTGSAGVQIGTDHQDAPQEFRAIMNASRRAAISSMMTLPGSALMPEGIRCFGEQQSPNSRWYSAPDCQSFKETHTELTTPVTEGIRCLGEQPRPNNR
jgi:hypothetical protein